MRISHLNYGTVNSDHTAAGYEAMPMVFSAIAAAVSITLAVFLCVKKKKKEVESDKLVVEYYDVDPQKAELPQAVLDEIREMKKQKKEFDDHYQYCKSHKHALSADLLEIVNEEIIESLGSKVAITESLKMLIGAKIRNLKRRASGSMYTEADTALVIRPLEQELRWRLADLERATEMVVETWNMEPPPDLPSSDAGLTTQGWADTGDGDDANDTSFGIKGYTVNVSCSGLDAHDRNGKSDPYFLVTTAGGRKILKSETIKKSLDPTFPPVFIPGDAFEEGPITITLMDWDRVTRDDLIGSCTIDEFNETVDSFTKKGKPQKWQLINPKKKGKKGYKDSGTLKCSVKAGKPKEVGVHDGFKVTPGSQYLEILDKMPIARRPGEDTMVGFIGADYLRAGGKLSPELPPLVEHFRDSRKEQERKLTLKILTDFDAYDVAYKYQVATGGQATLDRITVASKSFTLPSEKEYNKMTADKNAPKSTSLSFPVYMQKMAVQASIMLYKVVGAVVAVSGIPDLHIQAGGIKPFRRIISKTLYKYTNFAKCTDISRVTVACKSLEEIAMLLEKFIGCRQMQVLRIKNRFDSKWSPFDQGGYRDVQLTVLVQVGKTKTWRPCEIQLNLVEMVFIKDGAAHGAGYEALDLARAIGSFNSRTLRHVGKATEDQWFTLSVGALLEFDHTDVSLKGAAAFAPLMRSLVDTRLRVQVLKLRSCGIDEGSGIALGKVLETNTTLMYLDLEDNLFGPVGGQAICEALEFNATLTHINLRTNSLTDVAGSVLGNALKVNETLTHLNLEETHLHEGAGRTISEALIVNQSIREIALGYNQIGEKAGENIVRALKQNPLLNKIDLRYNAFSYELETELAEVAANTRQKCEVPIKSALLGQGM